MSIKVIECIYEKGIFRPLVKVDLEEGKRVKVYLKDDREEILDKYAGAIKLDRKVTLKEILELGKSAGSNDRLNDFEILGAGRR